MLHRLVSKDLLFASEVRTAEKKVPGRPAQFSGEPRTSSISWKGVASAVAVGQKSAQTRLPTYAGPSSREGPTGAFEDRERSGVMAQRYATPRATGEDLFENVMRA